MLCWRGWRGYVNIYSSLQWNPSFSTPLFFKTPDHIFTFDFSVELLFVFLGGWNNRNSTVSESLAWLNLYYTWLYSLDIEQFSIECRKTETKVITLSNRKGRRENPVSNQISKQLH